MQYTKSVTFSSNGSRTNQTSSTLKCAKGIIHRIDLIFPPGCFGLVNVQLFQAGHPIAPSNEGQVYSADDEIIIIPEFTELPSELNVLTIKGWNEDDTFDHTIRVRIYILPKNVLLPVGATEGILAGLKQLVLHPIVINKSDLKE